MSEPARPSSLAVWGVVSHGRFAADHGGHGWMVEVDYFDLGDRVTCIATACGRGGRCWSPPSSIDGTRLLGLVGVEVPFRISGPPPP